jgi:hypothetical protein
MGCAENVKGLTFGVNEKKRIFSQKAKYFRQEAQKKNNNVTEKKPAAQACGLPSASARG